MLLSLLLDQSQDLIFHFQKHEWSDHSLEMETILLAACLLAVSHTFPPAEKASLQWGGCQHPGSGVTGALVGTHGPQHSSGFSTAASETAFLTQAW